MATRRYLLNLLLKGVTPGRGGHGSDLVRIAAGIDYLERLIEAVFLRGTEGGGLEWVSDSLAEQIFFRALQRRDTALASCSLNQWLALPPTKQLDGALVKVGIEIFGIRPAGLEVVFSEQPVEKRSSFLARILAGVAPLKEKNNFIYGQSSQELDAFTGGLAILGEFNCKEKAPERSTPFQGD